MLIFCNKGADEGPCAFSFVVSAAADKQLFFLSFVCLLTLWKGSTNINSERWLGDRHLILD